MDRSSHVSGAFPDSIAWWRRRSTSTASTLASERFRLTHSVAVVTCALTPAYTIRWHLGPLPTTILENAVLVTIALFAYECWRNQIVPAWRTSVLIPAILFLIAGAISVVVAPDRRAALGLYRAYLIEPIAFGLVLINVVTTAQRALWIVYGLAAGGTAAGLANSVVVIQALRHHEYNIVNTPPVIIYNTANAVALFLVPLIAVTGAVALHWKEQSARLVGAALAVLGTIAVLLSFSRGGYLALAAVAIGLALSHRRRWFLLLGGAIGALALMAMPTIRHRVLTEIDLSNGHNTLVGRFHLWSVALQMLRTRPVFGAGLSGFATAIGPYWNQTNIDRYTYPHNIVLNFWSETGLLGLAAFGAVLVIGLVIAWRGWRHGTADWRIVSLGVLLALVAVIVHGLVDVPYWKNDLSLEFWALLALILAPAAAISAPAALRSKGA